MFGEQFSLLSLVDSLPRASLFLSSITIQLHLCTAPVQTPALGFDSVHFCLGDGLEDR